MFDSPRFGSAAVTGGELCFKLAEPSIHRRRRRPAPAAPGDRQGASLPAAREGPRDRAHQGAPAALEDQRSLHRAVGGDRRCGRDRRDVLGDVHDGRADDGPASWRSTSAAAGRRDPALTVCFDDMHLDDPKSEGAEAEGAPRPACWSTRSATCPASEDRDREERVAAPLKWELLKKGGEVRARARPSPSARTRRRVTTSS